ncbi:hypothetical protein HJFPF1_02854 [Paramyrothecium foliicola]|nr:hypothetical protein HJFPF1_02854 [Paramyrothecium foliicola]
MFPRASRLWALLCLALVLQLATAQSFTVIRRQDDRPDATTQPRPEPEPTSVNGDNQKSAETTKAEQEAPKSSSTITKGPSTPIKSTRTPIPTVTSSKGPIDNSTFFNDTIPEGQLPLRPEITPGWGVAGTILLLTGGAYTLIGIKNRWVHTFFSAAYAAALGITVLIVYVMTNPVSNGVQGGFVVATVVAGCIVGAAATFFKEITEGLGCALGGFCLSMWLLCLVPGGLLKTVPSKAIFISSFTVAGFAFYFSRWTRDWALMTMIAFAGATATVLGIDAFSRAGLKEFWAYVWDLNDNLFPLGADTYPITKGIRVETAAIIIIFIAGVISQVKLWRIVREQKKKRAAERAEAQRNLELEEENLGRQLEEDTARERRQWERAYGDVGSSTVSRDSYTGDGASEKKLRDSQNGSAKQAPSLDVIELNRMNDQGHSRSGSNPSLLTFRGGDGKFMVRVAADDVTPPSPGGSGSFNEKTHDQGHLTGDVTDVTTTNDLMEPHNSRAASKGPNVVPLPFKVPVEDDAQSQSNRSSVATFADDGFDDTNVRRQNSAANRLSRGSRSLLRKLSNSRRLTQDLTLADNGSTEVLVTQRHHDGDDGSIAATIDNESISSEHDDDDSMIQTKETADAEATIDKSGEIPGQSVERTDNQGVETPADEVDGKLSSLGGGAMAEMEGPATGAQASTEANEEGATTAEGAAGPGKEGGLNSPGKSKSSTSEASAPVSLTKDRLPRPLSRVAMSYRTNEWAKHLSHADVPELDELQILDTPVEAPAPIDIDDLQRTALDGIPAPAPAMKRTNSQMTAFSEAHNIQRSLSKQGPPSPPRASLDGQYLPGSGSPGANQFRASSAPMRSSAVFQPIAEEQGSGLAISYAAMAENGALRDSMTSPNLLPNDSPQQSPVPGVVSYSSPQTLIGQREMFLRSKSQGNFFSTMQDLGNTTQRPPSEAGSISNYPMYGTPVVTDPDDLPLNQRKQFMRQSSMMALSAQGPSGVEVSEGAPFDSHQPKRSSLALSGAARQAQLATFRQSVAQDLRSGTPLLPSSGRETPFASTTNLLGNSREAEVQRNIEMQRSLILGQKEAEAQRREIQRREKEWADKVFDERMRSGDLLDAHREVMRKMQRKAKD